jgi:hypothetical protein
VFCIKPFSPFPAFLSLFFFPVPSILWTERERNDDEERGRRRNFFTQSFALCVKAAREGGRKRGDV